MKTGTWDAIRVFDGAVDAAKVRLKTTSLSAPKGVEEVISQSWNRQLRNKQEQLAADGVVTEIRSYHLDDSEKPSSALYEKTSQ